MEPIFLMLSPLRFVKLSLPTFRVPTCLCRHPVCLLVCADIPCAHLSLPTFRVPTCLCRHSLCPFVSADIPCAHLSLTFCVPTCANPRALCHNVLLFVQSFEWCSAWQTCHCQQKTSFQRNVANCAFCRLSETSAILFRIVST